MSTRHPLSVNVVNGRGIARTAARGPVSVIGTATVFVVAMHFLAVILTVVLAVLLVALAVQVVRRDRARRTPAPVQYRRVDDAAARAHRARMAAMGHRY